ncbi:hypothetical protein IH992_19920 [Candidatus Poribacteria bacterium]|nr:hypothetical protein [Candidatus Poribacteria bacterium]
MNEIKIPPNLILLYADMTKTEIALHMAIRSMADHGKLKRNIWRVSQILGKCRRRLYEAEFRLKQRQLLYIHYQRNGTRDVPYWHVYELPVGTEAIPLEAIVKTDEAVEGEPKPKNVWRKLRDAIVGTELDNFDLTDSQ